MADVYTPTKTMDGAFLPAVGSPNTSIDSPGKSSEFYYF
ncbi:C3H1-type domain-containing protein [Caenorhabditis elegans]|uniref:C3H1-type domain-containing protein n=1 Tax=Caenorhabditis elegans TaxID=6239 RepID=H2KZI5_CAEEL|nr:C3H1-type domain-containing protein [Caenorhabditis elegans]CCD68297.1 C3H1-type domain-containing protein [Caenorhabditis elegans]|eukprot:NP_001024941.1 Zinc Finger Protein [Caenorhabditis elegans]